MKRSHIVPVQFLVLASMALAFVVLASPAAATSTCLGLGEYYTVARQCALDRDAAGSSLPMLSLAAAMVGLTLGMVTLRRHVLRAGG